jgi:hypothetical protein
VPISCCSCCCPVRASCSRLSLSDMPGTPAGGSQAAPPPFCWWQVPNSVLTALTCWLHVQQCGAHCVYPSTCYVAVSRCLAIT